MPATPDTGGFWREFCRLRGVAPSERHDVFAFGDSPALQDELVALVLHGPKRATAMLLLEHEVGGDPMPAEGGYGVVLDGAGRPRCVIRSTEVRVVPFREVDAAFAHDEGEGDRTLQSWRDNHRSYFERACARLGHTFTEDLPVVLERFGVVWAPAP
ncbi:MAG TPA: ASCH domain-containing protein [Geminicoccaceae bacterium]|nr:ASCH domain-containing protein [Geminicoccaceae bacterium]